MEGAVGNEPAGEIAAKAACVDAAPMASVQLAYSFLTFRDDGFVGLELCGGLVFLGLFLRLRVNIHEG